MGQERPCTDQSRGGDITGGQERAVLRDRCPTRVRKGMWPSGSEGVMSTLVRGGRSPPGQREEVCCKSGWGGALQGREGRCPASQRAGVSSKSQGVGVPH